MQTENKHTPNAHRRALDYNANATTSENESSESDPTPGIDEERASMILYKDTAFMASYKIVRDIWFDNGLSRKKLLSER